MNEKLSYEEWCEKYRGTIVVPDNVRRDLKEFHDIDADAEIEGVIRKEYEVYLSAGVKE